MEAADERRERCEWKSNAAEVERREEDKEK